MDRPSSVHCALGDGRSWTDLVTNSGELLGAEVGVHLDWRGGEGDLPEAALATFVHEATHHWSFLSPVGLAITKLKLDAWRYAASVERTGATPELLARLAEAWLRYETVVAALRPLAEGLAMFAEFDATRRRSHVASSEPLAWAEHLADDEIHMFPSSRLREFLDLPDPDTELLFHKNLVEALRLSEEAIQRRVNLFGQPLSTAGGGYLPGYLALRAAWVAGGPEVWRESDLFLRHVRATTYGDLGLVRALLADGAAATGSLDRILRRLTRQLEEVDMTRLGDLYGTTAAWSWAAAGNEFLDPPAHIYISLKRKQREGLALLQEVLTAPAPDDSPGAEPIASLMPLLVGCRRFLILGGAEVDVAMTGGVCYVSDGGYPLYRTDEYPAFLEGMGGRARIRAFVPVVGGTYRGSFVSIAGELIHVHVVGERDQIGADLEMFPDRFAELVALWDLGGGYDDLLNQVVTEHGISSRTADVRDRVAGDIERLYRSRATRLFPAGVAEGLGTDGLLPLAEYDRGVLEGLALLGLAGSIDPRRHALEARFRAAGLSLPDLLAWIDASAAQGRFPPVLRYGGSCLMSPL
jgi:hypothetical protein